jgi:hypothetical protein
MKSYTINAVFLKGEGILERTTYPNGSPAVVFHHGGYEHEALSVNLGAYGLVPPQGCIYVRDGSEHEGVPEAVVEAGIGTIVGKVHYGPYDSSASIIKLADDIEWANG